MTTLNDHDLDTAKNDMEAKALSMYKEYILRKDSNRKIGSFLKGTGWFIAAIGVIASLILGDICSIGNHYNFTVCIIGIASSIISSLAFFGFGAVICLINDIRDLLAMPSEGNEEYYVGSMTVQNEIYSSENDPDDD